MYRIYKYRLDLSFFKFVRLANADTILSSDLNDPVSLSLRVEEHFRQSPLPREAASIIRGQPVVATTFLIRRGLEVKGRKVVAPVDNSVAMPVHSENRAPVCRRPGCRRLSQPPWSHPDGGARFHEGRQSRVLVVTTRPSKWWWRKNINGSRKIVSLARSIPRSLARVFQLRWHARGGNAVSTSYIFRTTHERKGVRFECRHWNMGRKDSADRRRYRRVRRRSIARIATPLCYVSIVLPIPFVIDCGTGYWSASSSGDTGMVSNRARRIRRNRYVSLSLSAAARARARARVWLYTS